MKHHTIFTILIIGGLVLIPLQDAYPLDHVVNVGDDLQAVINEAKAGDRILIKAGTYYVTSDKRTLSGLLIDGKTSLTLAGEGDVSIIAKERMATILTIQSSEDVVISGLHLAHDVEKGYCRGSVVALWDTTNIRIEKSILDGSGTQAIVMKDVTGVTVTESQATHNTIGVFEMINAADVTIEKVNIVENDNSGSSAGYSKGILDITDSANVFFINNRIEKNQNGYFKKLTNSQNITIENNSFKENVFSICPPPREEGVKNTVESEIVGIPGTKRALKYRCDDVTCYEYPQYSVIIGANGDMLVKFKQGDEEMPPCEYVVNKGDYEVKNEWAEFFFGISGNLMFVDSGTGPDLRDVMIYDLTQRTKVYETSYSEPIVLTENDTLSFWLETEEASKENCPEYEKFTSMGLGAAIETKAVLDLNNFILTKSQETRCVARQ